jgi:hypothetical protein
LKLSIGKNACKEGEWERGRSGENKDREDVLIFVLSTSPFSLFTFFSLLFQDGSLIH